MSEELVGTGGYFDTPERSARQQLIAHLLRNAEQPVYLRAPAGAGKTRFCQRLREDLAEDFACAWLVGDAHLDVPAAVAAQLRASGGAELGRRRLLLVDDADALPATAVETLYELHRDGAQLLFCGRGERLPHTGPVGLHLVDLPPFTQQQSLAFLGAEDAAFAKRLGPVGATSYCRQAGGWPGRLLDRNGRGHAAPAVRGAHDAGRLMFWGGAVVLVTLAVLVLWRQDAVNSWFVTEPDGPDGSAPMLGGGSVELPLPPRPPPPPEPAEKAPVVTAVPLAGPVPDWSWSAEHGASGPATALPQAPAQLTGPDTVAAAVDAATAAGPQGVPTGPPADAATPPGPVPAADGDPPAPPEIATDVDPAPPRPTVAPPEPRVTAAPPGPTAALPAPETAAVPSPPVAVPAARADRGDGGLPGAAWLRRQPAQHYTLQLLGARDLRAVRRFVNTHGLQGDYAVAVRDLDGKPWYSLVYGSFADRAAALRGKAGLAGVPAKDAWPRRFADVSR